MSLADLAHASIPKRIWSGLTTCPKQRTSQTPENSTRELSSRISVPLRPVHQPKRTDGGQPSPRRTLGGWPSPVSGQGPSLHLVAEEGGICFYSWCGRCLIVSCSTVSCGQYCFLELQGPSYQEEMSQALPPATVPGGRPQAVHQGLARGRGP